MDVTELDNYLLLEFLKQELRDRLGGVLPEEILECIEEIEIRLDDNISAED